MRINQAKRIFMNEADSSPGNGAPAEPAVPAEPTATPTAPALDLDTLVARISGIVDEKIQASQNATHAALRKAGIFKQDKPPSEPTSTAQPTPSAPAAAQAGLTMADVEALLERKGIVSTRAAKHGLNDAQMKRFEAAMSSVSRESLAEEADAYLADMGLVKATPQPAPATATQQQATPPKPNISDRGTAAPTDLRDSEGVLNSRPLEMTDHDLDALKQKYGEHKGLQMFQDRVNAALRNIKIIPPGGARRR